ncbi:MAG: glycosyl transferase family 1 [Desulfovibrionaceae bacterium]|nr:glycosyl transferase family 1 [Desulfovibrionaceae bacterium]
MRKLANLVLVLGMHRSGTSVLTRALPVFKIDIGQHYLARSDNPKGFFEDATFVKLNELLLKNLGLSWQDPNAISTSTLLALANGEMGQLAAKYLETLFAAQSWFGLKDPRASRLLPFWLDVAKKLNINVKPILSLRHPFNVAASLAKRDGFSREKSSKLFVAYLKDCLQSLGELKVLVISYDALLKDTEGQILRLANFFNLDVDAKQMTIFSQSFLEEDLRHHQNLTAGVDLDASTKEALKIYTALLPKAYEPSAISFEQLTMSD